MGWLLCRAAVLTCLCLAALGCGGGEQSPTAQAVLDFYDGLNAGRHAEFKAMYRADMRSFFDDPGNDAELRLWAEAETRHGTIAGVEIRSDEVRDDGTADVLYTVRYGDGSSKDGSVKLVMEEGAWKLGLFE